MRYGDQKIIESPFYKRLFINRDDPAQMETLDSLAKEGWVLCAIEPPLERTWWPGSFFWFRRESRADDSGIGGGG